MLYHLTISNHARLPFARSEAERRALTRHLVELADGRLLLFCLVDDHWHGVYRCSSPGCLASSVRRALASARPDLEVDPAHLTPVETRIHLTRLVGYVLRQPVHHGIQGVRLPLWSGSCFADLIGARLLPGFSPWSLRQELPRLSSEDLFAKLELPVVRESDCPPFARLGPAQLLNAAAACLAVGPELRGRSAAVVQARSAAVRAAVTAGVGTAQLAEVLALTPRAIRNLRKRPAAPALDRALRLRLSLEAAVERAGAQP